jgi:flagellar motility protein MotE (MotC chaperone)
MKKKIIIITSAAGIVGFAGMFAFAWFTSPKPSPEISQMTQAGPAEQSAPQTDESSIAAGRIAEIKGQTSEPLPDQQLQALIYEVREKIKEYSLKLRELDVREKRLTTAQDDLKKDIEEMASLRVELAAAVASLKNEQEKLIKTKVEIDKTEQENLIAIAAAYDKMDAESAGKILMNMIQSQNPGSDADDAVKILYYMTERTKAKVLASMAEAEPAVSAYLCQKLKRMITKE